ncbi:Salicylyl-CoA 5-hydroxylase OS=Streptomyces glaucescens OX=1907 GN=SGLAU_25615 PE=4 SV=1 [Streptomyces glaucescens]
MPRPRPVWLRGVRPRRGRRRRPQHHPPTYPDAFRPRLTAHRCRYLWLAADFAFDAFRFDFAETEHGLMHLHGYPYAPDASTVIVEMREEVWRRPASTTPDDRRLRRPLRPDLHRRAAAAGPAVQRLRLATTFRTLVTERWSHGNVVLLGDAAHTAHFSIGSGTKLAVEDALALAAALAEQPTVAGP